MKRITIEQAEESPLHLGMHKKLTNSRTVSVDKVYFKFHHEIPVCNHIYRFINKYVGKKYDTCYSDYIHWIKSERIFNNIDNYENMLELFKDNFLFYVNNFYYRQYCKFDVVDGIIVPIPKEPRKKYLVYKEYIYSLKPNYCNEYLLWNNIGGKELRRLKNGISFEDYTKFINDERLDFGRVSSYAFAKTPIGEPLEGREKKRYYAEKAKKERKQYRDNERKKREYIDSIVIKSYATVRERKKQQKRIDKANAKREEELNIITRDRLGFDEESFKTPQKFK